jgi:methyl-accepting chemotaxis protein
MDEMTQHNAALVQETNSAIEQTEGQASELDRIVEVFVMEDDETVRRRGQRVEVLAGAPQPMYDRPWPKQRNTAAA